MSFDIPGTTLFDGAQARKGYALNKMCFSFNEATAPSRAPVSRTLFAENPCTNWRVFCSIRAICASMQHNASNGIRSGCLIDSIQP